MKTSNIDAGLCIPYLEALGWQADWVAWRRPDVNWDSYVLIEPSMYLRMDDEAPRLFARALSNCVT